MLVGDCCKRPSYVSSKMPLTSTAAIAAYEKTLVAFLICGILLQVSIIDLVFQTGEGDVWRHL